MKVLITGSRDWKDREAIESAIKAVGATLVIHGDAPGADSIAHAVATSLGIDIVRFPANWNGRGKSAGPFRNRLMFDTIRPDIVLAFPLPMSKGTVDMMKYAEAKGCPVIAEQRYDL